MNPIPQQFVVNDEGNRTAVIVPWGEWQQLLEELDQIQVLVVRIRHRREAYR